MAAVLAAGDLGLLSHRSAGALWRIVPVIQGPVHVTSAVGGRRQGGIIFHRTRSLGARERSERYSIPVTSPARTLLDVAGVLAPRQFERAFHEADRLGLLNVPDLQHLCDQATGRRGLQRLRSLVAEYCPAPETRSVLEYRFIQFCRTYGLPPPAVNVPVCGFEVDFY